MRKTGNNIKKMEWTSNQKQIQMKDKILKLLGKKKVILSVSRILHCFFFFKFPGVMFATLGIRKRIQTQESSAGESGEDIVEQV